ncbi:hypothetical protein ID866_10556 [Astraeus odoratus]|nr:hypothetical protein ID866_10556 [Astraeus odoratus]
MHRYAGPVAHCTRQSLGNSCSRAGDTTAKGRTRYPASRLLVAARAQQGQGAHRAEDEQHRETVAQLLLEDKESDELAAAIRKVHAKTGSAGLPAPHTRPAVLTGGTPRRLARGQYLAVGADVRWPAAASSVQPIPSRPLGTITPRCAPPARCMRLSRGRRHPFRCHVLRRVLLVPGTPGRGVLRTYIRPLFLIDVCSRDHAQTFDDVYSVPSHAQSPSEFPLAPLDVAPTATTCEASPMPQYAIGPLDMSMVGNDPATWLSTTAAVDFASFPEFADMGEFSQSQPSSAYSGSPARSDVSQGASGIDKAHQQVLAQGVLDGLFEGGPFGGTTGALSNGDGLALGFDYTSQF